MTGIILVAAIVAVVTVATLLMKVPAVLVFFSLLVGQLLADQISEDVYYFVGSLVSSNSGHWIRPVLLFLPVLLTMLFLRGTVSRRKMMFEFIPAILTGVATVLLLVPMVSGLQNALSDDQIWKNTVLYKGLILFTASLASLITCWFTFSKSHRS